MPKGAKIKTATHRDGVPLTAAQRRALSDPPKTKTAKAKELARTASKEKRERLAALKGKASAHADICAREADKYAPDAMVAAVLREAGRILRALSR